MRRRTPKLPKFERTASGRVRKRVLRPMAAKTLGWAAVRHDFETTLISVRGLTRLHGIKGETTLRRGIRAEKWQRKPEAVIRSLVERALDGFDGRVEVSRGPLRPCAPRAAPDQERKGGEDSRLERSLCAEDAGARSGAHNVGGICGGASRHQASGGMEGVMPAPDRVRAPLDEAARIPAGMTAEQKRALREQAQAADLLARVGMAMMLELQMLLTRGDPEEIAWARARLTRLHPGRERLARLAVAATSLITRAAGMKRRALGMGKAAHPHGPHSVPAGLDGAAKLIKSLPQDVLDQLREAGAKVRAACRKSSA